MSAVSPSSGSVKDLEDPPRLDDQESQQQLPQRPRKSAYYWGFRLLSRFHRLFGQCFLNGLDGKDPYGVHVRRCSFLGVYGIMVAFLPEVWNLLVIVCPTNHQRSAIMFGSTFSPAVMVLFMGYMFLASFVARIIVFFKAHRFQKFQLKCIELEWSQEWNEDLRESFKLKTKFFFLFHLVTLCYAFLYWYDDLDLVVRYYVREDAGKGWYVLFGFLATFINAYLFISIIVLPMWLVFNAYFFKLVFRKIAQELQFLLIEAEEQQEKLAQRLQRLRRLYVQACTLVGEADDLVSPGILIFYAGMTLFACSCAFYGALPEVALLTRCVYLCKLAITIFFLYFPADVASIMKDQVHAAKCSISTFPMEDLSPPVRQEVLAFLLTCQAQVPQFTGSKYFTVERPLLVLLSGAIVTYVLILIQGDGR